MSKSSGSVEMFMVGVSLQDSQYLFRITRAHADRVASNSVAFWVHSESSVSEHRIWTRGFFDMFSPGSALCYLYYLTIRSCAVVFKVGSTF